MLPTTSPTTMPTTLRVCTVDSAEGGRILEPVKGSTRCGWPGGCMDARRGAVKGSPALTSPVPGGAPRVHVRDGTIFGRSHTLRGSGSAHRREQALRTSLWQQSGACIPQTGRQQRLRRSSCFPHVSRRGGGDADATSRHAYEVSQKVVLIPGPGGRRTTVSTSKAQRPIPVVTDTPPPVFSHCQVSVAPGPSSGVHRGWPVSQRHVPWPPHLRTTLPCFMDGVRRTLSPRHRRREAPSPQHGARRCAMRRCRRRGLHRCNRGQRARSARGAPDAAARGRAAPGQVSDVRSRAVNGVDAPGDRPHRCPHCRGVADRTRTGASGRTSGRCRRVRRRRSS